MTGKSSMLTSVPASRSSRNMALVAVGLTIEAVSAEDKARHESRMGVRRVVVFGCLVVCVLPAFGEAAGVFLMRLWFVLMVTPFC